MAIFFKSIGSYARACFHWLLAQILFFGMRILKLFPADAALDFADWLARAIGPHMRRHRLVLYNLSQAFPEKSTSEIGAIALASWGGMGRMAAEYIFLDSLFDLDPLNPQGGRIEITGHNHFEDIVRNPRPFIFFASHSGWFELIPIIAAAFGVTPTILFRPPNNPYIAAKVDAFRRARMGRLVPSHAGSSLTLARALAKGDGIGVLVDQKYAKGIASRFFNQPVATNPLVPKLARQFDCEVFPIHCIRLPGNRYRVAIEPAINLARTYDGKPDATAIAQQLNDRVETWVRAHPGQWLWYHDRWDIKRKINL